MKTFLFLATAVVLMISDGMAATRCPGSPLVSPNSIISKWTKCRGDVSFPNIGQYSGDFVNGKRSGKGSFTWVGNDRFEGEWLDGAPNGAFSFFHPNGKLQTGFFKNDKLTIDADPVSDSDLKLYRIPMVQSGGVFSVPTNLNGQITLNFIVDSGAADITIPADVARTLIRTKTISDSDFRGEQLYTLADGSTTKSRRFVLRKVTIGDISAENIEASISNVEGPLLLGQSFLKKFKTWSIDNSKHELILGDRVGVADRKNGHNQAGKRADTKKQTSVNSPEEYTNLSNKLASLITLRHSEIINELKQIPQGQAVISKTNATIDRNTDNDDAIAPAVNGSLDERPTPVTATLEELLGSSKAIEWNEKSVDAANRGKWAEAIRSAEIAIANSPKMVQAYVNRCRAYLGYSYLDEAEADCKMALQLQPANTAAINNSSVVKEQRGAINEALAGYKNACENGFTLSCDNFKRIKGYSPADPKGGANLKIQQALKQFDSNQWEDAIRLADEAIAIYPASPLAYIIKSGAKANLNMLDEAIADANTAIKLEPNNGFAYNNRGYASQKKNDTRKAMLDYEVGCSFKIELACKNFRLLKESLQKPAQ